MHYVVSSVRRMVSVYIIMFSFKWVFSGDLTILLSVSKDLMMDLDLN